MILPEKSYVNVIKYDSLSYETGCKIIFKFKF